MKKYYCKCCNFQSNLRSDYERHLKTKKHSESTFSQHLVNKKSTLSQQKVNIICFCCKYCSKEFTTKQSMYRHIKYTCKNNKDEDLKELVKLLNEQMKEQKEEINNMKIQLHTRDKLLDRRDKQLEKRDKQIVKLTNKLQINNNCIIQNNNIQLLNYTDTDITHLSDVDYINSLKRVNNCVKTLTEKIHFNPEKPENMNIYISNLKNDYITVYENGQWQLKKGFDDIYDHKEIMLEEWLEKEQNNYPELRDKFEKYLDNKESDVILNQIKDDIKLMMYNNKNNIIKKV